MDCLLAALPRIAPPGRVAYLNAAAMMPAMTLTGAHPLARFLAGAWKHPGARRVHHRTQRDRFYKTRGRDCFSSCRRSIRNRGRLSYGQSAKRPAGGDDADADDG